MTATNSSAPRMPSSTWTSESRMKKTTIPPTTTAPTLAQFIAVPLSLRAHPIIVVVAADRVGGQGESGKTQGKPGARPGSPGGKEAQMQALASDIGGSGIKGAAVDLAPGKLLADRKKVLTPRPATPDA